MKDVKSQPMAFVVVTSSSKVEGVTGCQDRSYRDPGRSMIITRRVCFSQCSLMSVSGMAVLVVPMKVFGL